MSSSLVEPKAARSAGRVLGIPFSDEMVRAIAAGVKTQTRRIEETYRVGDVLYVREAWRTIQAPRDPPGVMYCADGEVRPWPPAIWNEYQHVRHTHGDAHRPPMFMFRALARRWLVVTEHSTMRLQTLTEEQAMAEGSWLRHAPTLADFDRRGLAWNLHGRRIEGARGAFAKAWNDLYAKRPHLQWAANPHIHAYTFRPARPEEVPTRG